MLLHRTLVVLGAAGLTATFFLVLPMIQAISAQKGADTVLQSVDTAIPPPPDPIEEEPPPEEDEEEEEPPELDSEAPRPDLSQLELALNPGSFTGDGWAAGISSALQSVSKDSGNGLGNMAGFAVSRSRAVHRVDPTMSEKLRRRAPATVWLLFIVDERGRVESPKVEKSTDPLFEKPALSAIKKWKFDPGKRGGKPAEYRMRLPMTFPRQS